ncbi:neutral zinc metallopeptidase [Nocardiopsis sp. NPDC049922]|uniref:neutral zinc metallopeptidase n=1 Tax=Nocardiopsis sp. NPDC049922 TaxID=3155157 RepID=UPI0033D4D1D8
MVTPPRGAGTGFWSERPGFVQRLGLSASFTLCVGLAAVGFTGFLATSEMLAPAEASWSGSHPIGAAGQAPEPTTAEAPLTDSGGDPLLDNALYEVGELGEVTCGVPELDADDPASMEAFAHAIADCLDQAWSAYFAEAGLEFASPNRVYWYAEGHSPCGPFPEEDTAAFYCQANQGLYLGVEDIVAASAGTDRPEAYTFLLSHEYGHHVQGQSRMLAEFRTDRAAADPETADELTRRNELQADCLGGVFLGASGASLDLGAQERANILDDVARRGDHGAERTHGQASSGRLWTEHGMDRRDPAACNTWKADGELVR